MKKGFTLVELLSVLLIVAILTAVGVPQYRKVIEKARVSEAQVMLRTIYDSSERLAQEFGYHSYNDLLARKGEKGYSFERFDMFDRDNLPAGCVFQDAAGSHEFNNILKCKRFAYRASIQGYVAAKKLGTPYEDTYILFDRQTHELWCQPSSRTSEACDVFGLDVKDARVSF